MEKNQQLNYWILWATRASLVAPLVKNLPAMQETWVQSLGWEDPWRREKLPTAVFWPGEFRGLYSPWGLEELDKTERLSFHFGEQDRGYVPSRPTGPVQSTLGLRLQPGAWLSP